MGSKKKLDPKRLKLDKFQALLGWFLGALYDAQGDSTFG